MTMFLAREILEFEKCKLDGRPSGFGIPYRFYVGIKTEFFDFIEQNRTFDSLGEDLGWHNNLSHRVDPGAATTLPPVAVLPFGKDSSKPAARAGPEAQIFSS